VKSAKSKPECKLSGEEGNVFSIIGRVRNVLNSSKRQAEAREFMKKAFASSSYDEVLNLAQNYVEVV